MTEAWSQTLEHRNFVKAIVQREFRPFHRFYDDLYMEGLIEYHRTVGKIEKTRMRWISIKNKLWQYIDEKLLCEKNRNRKEKRRHMAWSDWPEYEDESGARHHPLDRYLVDEKDTFDMVSNEELVEKVKERLMRLGSETFDLFMQGYDQVEIGERLDIPTYMVYNRIKQIRKVYNELKKDMK
ncbi:hypothetical protein [Hydrogenimonas urashimensis]|uniref:hypothetical protein n=1 Tax=Hydrogenimonas urashimensis TaxID=2740515 RepID=UPI0019166EF1|nr:hypothetical protein [Hydrogenimonas urashimensis]